MNPTIKAQMDKDLADFRASKAPTSGGNLRVQMDKDLADFRAGKTSPVQSNASQFNVAPIETRDQKITRYNSESAALAEKSKEANSIWGMTKNFGKAFGGAIASSEVGLDQSLQKIYGNQSDTYLEQTKQTDEIQTNLLKQIRKNDAEGKDSTKLKQLYNEGQKTGAKLQEGLTQETTLPTSKQVGGQLAGTALDLLTAGTYGKAKTGSMAFGRLAPSASTLLNKTAVATGNAVLPTLAKIAENKATGLFTKQGFSNVVKGASIGAATDVTQNMQNNEDNIYKLGLGTILGAGIPALSESTATFKNNFTKSSKTNKVIEKRAEAIDQLNKYKVLSVANEKATERGINIKSILSKSDVLSGAVDNTGTINTKFEGGAIDQYTKQFINGNEDLVSKILQKDGNFVNPDIVKKDLIEKVKNSGAQGKSLTEALANINREVEGYKIFANENGQIPLEVIHKAKIDKYSNINFMTDAEKQKYEKTIAKGLKEIVENNTKGVDVKKLNEELSKHFAVINYLEKLDGKKVDGGKLGKYFAQMTGAYIGGMVGGPLGAVAGAEVGSRTKGAMMSRTFNGKTGGVIPEGQPITQAKNYINQENIQLPQSNKVGNRYIPQSTTITNTINDISKNIPQSSQKSIEKHIGTAFQTLNDPNTAKLISDNPGAFIKQTNANIVMGLKGEGFIKEAQKLSTIDLSKVTSISDLASQMEKKLGQKTGFIQSIINKVSDTPNKQGGFAKIPSRKPRGASDIDPLKMNIKIKSEDLGELRDFLDIQAGSYKPGEKLIIKNEIDVRKWIEDKTGKEISNLSTNQLRTYVGKIVDKYIVLPKKK